jgi:hypothetical protein
VFVPNVTAGNSSTYAANTAFVTTAINNLKSAGNIWTGSTNTFNNLTKFGAAGAATQITIDTNSIISSNVNDTISMFDNLSTGMLKFCNNLIFKKNNMKSSGLADVVDLFDNLTTGTLKVANNLAVNGVLNMGGLGLTTIGGKLNIGLLRLFGHERHKVHDGATGNYTITNLGRNIDFYVIVVGIVNCSVILATLIQYQVVYIRNAMGAGNFNNVISSSGNNIIRAGGGVTNMITLTENRGVMLYCDGGSWIVMMNY